MSPLCVGGLAERVVYQRSELHRAPRRLDVRPRRGQRDDLHVDAVLVEHAGAIGEIAMAADGDVVVARVVQDRVAFRVHV